MATICLNCATVALEPSRDRAVCAACGKVHDAERYDRIVAFAERTVRYGFQYRQAYEAQKKSGRSGERYALIPSDQVLTFVALAILSGVLGNAAYDTIKLVISKIRRQYPRLEAAIVRQLDEELTVLEEYLIDFATQPQVLPDKVFGPVIEEVIVDYAEELHRERDPNYLERFATAVTNYRGDMTSPVFAVKRELLEEARRRLPERLVPPPPDEWDELWKNAGSH